MPMITEEAIWAVGAKARQAAEGKSDAVALVVKIAVELAVPAITELAVMTDDEVQGLTRIATQIATAKFSDFVADLADELVDHFLI